MHTLPYDINLINEFSPGEKSVQLTDSKPNVLE